MEYTFPTPDCVQPVKYKRILRALMAIDVHNKRAVKAERINTEIAHINLVVASRQAEIEHLQLAKLELLIELTNLSQE